MERETRKQAVDSPCRSYCSEGSADCSSQTRPSAWPCAWRSARPRARRGCGEAQRATGQCAHAGSRRPQFALPVGGPQGRRRQCVALAPEQPTVWASKELVRTGHAKVSDFAQRIASAGHHPARKGMRAIFDQGYTVFACTLPQRGLAIAPCRRNVKRAAPEVDHSDRPTSATRSARSGARSAVRRYSCTCEPMASAGIDHRPAVVRRRDQHATTIQTAESVRVGERVARTRVPMQARVMLVPTHSKRGRFGLWQDRDAWWRKSAGRRVESLNRQHHRSSTAIWRHRPARSRALGCALAATWSR